MDLDTPAKAILVTGFLIQIISFGIFAIIARISEVHRFLIHRHQLFLTLDSQRRAARANDLPNNAKYLLWTLYGGCVLILIRSIFRTIEFADGKLVRSSKRFHIEI